MTDTEPMTEFDELAPIDSTAVSPIKGIAAIALSLAIKYHDIGTIKDGVMYQQYKLEGRELRPLDLDMVFETAMRIEMHLLQSEKRIQKIIIDCLEVALAEDEEEKAPP